jgi:hypothetical protein
MRNYRSEVSVCIGGQGFTMPPKDIAALAHGPRRRNAPGLFIFVQIEIAKIGRRMRLAVFV